MSNRPSRRTRGTCPSIQSAISLHQQGVWDQAEKAYQQILERTPANVDALHFYGVLRHNRGDSRSAVDLIRRSLQINPDYKAARLNLGNVLHELGRLNEAEAEYRRLLEQDADNAQLLNNLGIVLKRQRKLDAAIAILQRAIEVAPDYADAHHNLGNALKAVGQIEDALTAYRRAIEIQPDHSESHMNLGRALYRFDRIDEAATVFAKWLQVEPDNPVAMHMLAACTGRDMPPRASDAFVRQTFDGFAASFDEVLARLHYQAPALVAQALERLLPESSQPVILDAGCGTGLCGPLVRRKASRLVGVDLSPRMIEKARGLGCYDVLHVAELTEFMAERASEFDACICADTLVYFGELTTVFAAAATAIRPNGWFVFTVEYAEDLGSGAGHRLNPHGRYSHRRDYVERELTQARFDVASISAVVLREECLRPVPGLLVAARRG